MNIEDLKPQIIDIGRKYDLEFIVLFGSQATGRTHSKSDIDIGIISKTKFDKFKVIGDFQNVFQREDVEVVDLGKTAPTLMYAVVHDGKLLYEKTFSAFLLWKLYAMKVWMDTKWLRDLKTKRMIEWAAQIQ